MFFFRTWQLGVKSLLLHPMRSLLTVLGIFIGVASVIWLLAISVGISDKVQQQIEELGRDNVIIRSVKPASVAGGEGGMFLDYGIKRFDHEVILETVPTISGHLRIRELQATVKYGTRDETDVRLVGCTPEYLEAMRLTLKDGHFISPSDMQHEANHCILAHETAQHLFPIDNPLGETVLVNEIGFVVVGVMEPRTAMAGIGGSLSAQEFNKDIYIPITTFWRRYGDTRFISTSGSRSGEIQELSQVTYQIDKPENVMPTADVIRATLKARHANEDYAVVVPLELIEHARSMQIMFMVFMGLIAAISLVVGGIGIMNIMLATVTERTREIGIRRAIGAKRRHIIMQFMIETLVLSIVGGITGIVIGLLCPPAIYWTQQALERFAPDFVATLPETVRGVTPIVRPEFILLAAGISIVVGVVFGIYPAIRAARMDPIEALRHE
jgi:putative ABC transport system permease protein